MYKPGGIALAAALWGAALPVTAQEAPKEMRPYLSGMFSHVFEEDERDDLVGGSSEAVEDGNGLQLGFGIAASERIGAELSVFGHRFDNGVPGSPSLEDRGVRVEGLYFYSRNPEFSPYFSVGTGAIRTEVNNAGHSTDGFADVGLGFMKFFDVGGTDLGLRGDLRYRHVFLDDRTLGQTGIDDLGEAVLKIGLVVPLGERPAAPVEVAPAPAPEPPGPCPDADGDGVCDDRDECPETPAGTQVGENGCPVEPAEPAPSPAARQFEDVHFAFDQSRLTDYAKALLDNAAQVIAELAQTYPELRVEIFGHTDSVGTDGYNVGLGERRANVVREYLLRKGVEGSRMSTQSYGESRPKATNDTDEGRALNRRAEVRTVEK